MLNRSALTFLATLLVTAGIMAWVISRVDRESGRASTPVGWQAWDVPREGGGVLDPWLILPDAWMEATVPVADAIGPSSIGDLKVHAVADGIVIFCGLRDGNLVVILAHRSSDGSIFESIYEPLSSVTCRVGELIGRGTPLGLRDEREIQSVLRRPPADLEERPFEPSTLTLRLAEPGQGDWQNLEIGNAEKMLELAD